MRICGLDFGTSNTTLSLAEPDGRFRLAALEGESTTLPSAAFFDFETSNRLSVGREAMAAYVGGFDGRLMRSLKSVLGTSLVDEETALDGSRISFRQVIARFLSVVRQRGNLDSGGGLDSVVMGRPVHFVDNDEEGDEAAEEALHEIARRVGFRQVSFQFEPIAAALDYEQRIDREQVAMVADIGGGTSDFSIVRIGPARRAREDRTADILSNEGVRVGGVDFDRELSLAAVMPLLGYRSPMQRAGLSMPNHYFTDLATWSKVNFLYRARVLEELRQVRRESARPALVDRLLEVLENRRGHSLAIEVERAKIALSETAAVTIDLDWIEHALAATADRATLDRASDDLVARIAVRARRCLSDASLAADRVDALFLTGGSTLLPQVRAGLIAELPAARVVDGDKFGSVGLGLAVEARRRYGEMAAP